MTRGVLPTISMYTHAVILVTGPLSQYLPPSEWIMCELGVFPSSLENNLLKVDKILGLPFFRQENKTSKDSKGRFSIYCD